MYSNKILNFQDSTTILNACTKKSDNLLKAPHIFSLDFSNGELLLFEFNFLSNIIDKDNTLKYVNRVNDIESLLFEKDYVI